MRKVVLGACLGLAFAGSVIRGEEPEVTKKSSIWPKWFSKDKNVKTEEGDTQDKSKSTENDEAMLLYQQASKRAQEETEYFRRLEACDKLMEIAIQRNDLAMQRQIEELNGRIQEIYNRKTKFLSATAGKGDEVLIEKTLAKSAKPVGDSRSRFFARDKSKEKDATASAQSKKKGSKEEDQ